MPEPLIDEEQREVVDFKCPQCGANTAYSASEGGLICTHCGYYEAPEKPAAGRKAIRFEFTLETMDRSSQGWGEARKELACQSCGALTTIPTDSLSHTCPFCGSNEVLQRSAAQDHIRPRYLIPFKIEAEACKQLTRSWMGSSWMTPSSLKNLANIPAFNGIYLPFWTFDATTHANWRAEVGHIETERYYDNGEWKTRTVTRWKWEAELAELKSLRPGRARDKAFKRQIDQANPGLRSGELTPYEAKYLAGLNAKAYDVPLEEAWEIGRREMREQTRDACLAQASSNQVRNFNMNLDFAEESWQYVLLPVYLTTYRVGEASYQVMVNGQNGLISGQRPADWNKIWLAIAALISPGLFLGAIGLLTIPLGGVGLIIGGLGFILLVAGLIISVIIYQKAQALDDI